MMQTAAFFVFVLASYLAAGSGVSVHVGMVGRVRGSLPEDVQKYTSYLHAGAFFPDSFYNCFGLNEASEAAHWPPFLLSAVKHYRGMAGAGVLQGYRTNRVKEVYMARYSQQRTNRTVDSDARLKFKAFLYGMLTHQIADSTWHSIRMDHGLLKHLAAVEFDGDLDAAHTFLDTGGDFLLLNKLAGAQSGAEGADGPGGPLKLYFLSPWDAPVDDLLSIYHQLGFGSVSKEKLNHCMHRGHTALGLEVNSYRLSSVMYMQRSPYLNDILDDYYLGGLEEIETSIVRCVENLNDWLDSDDLSNIDPWSLCPHKIVKPGTMELFAGIESLQNSTDIESLQNMIKPAAGPSNLAKVAHSSTNKGYFVSPMVPNARFGNDIELGYFLGQEIGLCAAVGSIYEEIDGSIYVIPLLDLNISSTMGRRELETMKINLNSDNNVQDSQNAENAQNVQKYGYNSAKNSQNPQKYDYNPQTSQNAPKYGYKIKNFMFEIVNQNSTIKHELIVVVSPGTSTVNTLKGSTKLLTFSFEDLDIDFQQTGLHFELVDINGDGIQDFVFSSPFVSFKNRKNADQSGMAIILDGQQVLARILSGNPQQFAPSSALVASYKEFKPILLTIPDELRLPNGYENFGSSLSVNSKYLYLGVQGISSVLVYNVTELSSSAKPQWVLPHDGKAPISFASIKSTGALPRTKSKSSGQFGSRFIASGFDNQTVLDWVLVSAHSETVGLCSKCGALYLYANVHGNTPKLISRIVLHSEAFNYDFSFSKFGYNGHVVAGSQASLHGSAIQSNSTTLFISSPRLNNSGAIWKLKISQLLEQYAHNEKPSLVKLNNVVIDQIADTYVGVGKAMKSYVDANGQPKLVVGMPDFGYSELSDAPKQLTGRIGIYNV